MDDVWTKVSNARLGTVAQYALNNPPFRQAATDPGTAQSAIENDAGLAQALDSLGLGRLSEEEIAFCIGWADLAKGEFTNNDAGLVAALQRQLGSGGPAG